VNKCTQGWTIAPCCFSGDSNVFRRNHSAWVFKSLCVSLDKREGKLNMQIKSHESPRSQGRNHKGKGGSARKRQLDKRNRQLRNQLKKDRSSGAVFLWADFLRRTSSSRALRIDIDENRRFVSTFNADHFNWNRFAFAPCRIDPVVQLFVK
jgi:hypothetical protein